MTCCDGGSDCRAVCKYLGACVAHSSKQFRSPPFILAPHDGCFDLRRRGNLPDLAALFRTCARIPGEYADHSATCRTTGLARVLLRGQPFDLFFWQVPTLMEPHPATRGVFAEAHEAGATALAILIALHVSAALFHHLVLRDDVPQRMLPQNFSHRKNARHGK